jgi:hypothetical protein
MTLFMPTIKIDNVDYDTDKLSDEAKAQLIPMQFCDQALQRLQAQAAAFKLLVKPLTKPCKQPCHPHRSRLGGVRLLSSTDIHDFAANV